MKVKKTSIYIAFCLAASLFSTAAFAEPSHGISMTGTLDLPADFDHLPYVNPEAKPGGRIVYAELGSYDSFSPFITAGKAPYGFKAHIYESFLKRSADESFSLYGLLAEKVDMSEDRKSVEFFLNPLAKFSDGTPVTIEDAMWSYQILGEKGVAKYGTYMSGVTKIEKTGDYSLKFELTGENRELPLLLGMMPIMKKSDFDGVEFDKGVTRPTIGSGAYIVSDYKMGESITFKRNPDYWGKDLPINKGQNNLEEIKYVYITDPEAIFEAFKAGDVTIFEEGDPKRWNSYEFDRFKNGDVDKISIKHSRPAGLQGFFLNTRHKPLDDWRVREALITGFNFPFINQTINEGAFTRITSMFSNSYLGMTEGPAEGKTLELLNSAKESLLPGAIEGYALPAGEVSGRDREGVAHALELLKEAGYEIVDGVMQGADGKPLEISVMVKSQDEEKLANLWADGLKPIGVTLKIETVDEATHKQRIGQFDYDAVFGLYAVSLSPGTELFTYFGAEAADTPESRNYTGTKQPAFKAVIDAILAAPSLEDYIAAVQALDRLVMSERLVVPTWYKPELNIVKDKHLKFPSYVPKFGYWPGYAPESIYWEE